MIIEETSLDGCLIIYNKVIKDSYGCFVETYNDKDFKKKTGLNIIFVQDNQSRSSKGVLRGLHMSTGKSAQTKLVHVVEGVIFDVAVDLRKSSPTFGQHFGIELSADNHKQLFIPEGFAHGFIVLSEFATVIFKVNNYYQPGNEIGIIYNDFDLNIDWNLDPDDIRLSERDQNLGTFADYIEFKKNKTKC